MSRPLDRGPGGGLWCREHKCYHAEPLDLTQSVALEGIRRRFKLTTRQAKEHGLEIDGDIVFIPQRSRHPSGWEIVRYRWRMDGTRVCLEVPDETGTQGLS